jgi:hypothetical protein
LHAISRNFQKQRNSAPLQENLKYKRRVSLNGRQAMVERRKRFVPEVLCGDVTQVASESPPPT